MMYAGNGFEALSGAAFLAFPDMQDWLLAELRERLHFFSAPAKRFGDLFYFPDFPIAEALKTNALPYWAKCVMLNPVKIHFHSISGCAAALRSIQRNWAPYQSAHFRRAALIQTQLPYINLKPRAFPVRIPHSPIGLWTLITPDTALASAQTTSLFPSGSIIFEEDHENPPSRAYLKLQEALTVAAANGGALPQNGTRCFEAGASPGGWTWVLTKLGATVLAVDRAELAPPLMADPLVTFLRHDAFTLEPERIGPCDWLLCDVACYPERLYDWICRQLASGFCGNMICTVKIQGAINWQLIDRFAALPDSRIVHLNYNKHELTWIKIPHPQTPQLFS